MYRCGGGGSLTHERVSGSEYSLPLTQPHSTPHLTRVVLWHLNHLRKRERGREGGRAREKERESEQTRASTLHNTTSHKHVTTVEDRHHGNTLDQMAGM